MAAQVLFNPLAYVDRLTRGGFSPEQARASAEALETAFSEGVATKSDVADSKHEVQASIEALKHELQAGPNSESRLRLEFKRDISESETRVRREIAQSKNETLRWLFGFVIVLIGANFTIVKFVR